MLSSKPTIAAIYNPKIQSQTELIDRFIVRQELFEKLFAEIKESPMQYPEQHYLIEGKRGMGKTSLLLRLCYAIEQDEQLQKTCVPLVFNEEEYSIRKLFRFWERIIQMLEDQSARFKGLSAAVKLLSKKWTDDDLYEKELFQLLSDRLQSEGQKIILFIDNFGELFLKFNEKEAHRLRKILQTSADLRIFAASSVVLESFYLYKHPFYEFFKIVRLKGLNFQETRELLIKLAEVHQQLGVREIVQQQPGRVEVLRRLTGGVIRTIILLFEIFIDDQHGDAFADLEHILDRVTPLYKHRMDDLPSQQQQIVEAIALSWDAVNVKTISELTRMESKVISAQLNQLVKSEMVTKIKTNTKNHLYQLTERFFNIWYLMRHGRNNDRSRVRWLVRFLEEWCNTAELVERAKRHVSSMQKGAFNQRGAYLLSEALASTKNLPKEEQHELLLHTRHFLNSQQSRYLQQLSQSDIELQHKAREAYRRKQYQVALDCLLQMKEKDYFQIAHLYQKGLKNYPLAENYYKKASKTGHPAAMNNLGVLYQYHFNAPEKAQKCYLQAAQQHNPKALYNLALLYKNHFKDYPKAEHYYLEAVAQGDQDAMFNLGNLYANELRAPQKARNYYLMASESGHFRAMSNLAYLYTEVEQDFEAATVYFKKSLQEGLLYNEDFLDISENHPLLFHFMFLLARKEYDFLYRCFHEEQLADIQLKDRLKPLYYSLLYFKKQELPNEYLRMGPELKETVDEIVEEVQEMTRRYQ
ncbi:MAG: hypothetical protein AAGD05_00575 [Bacteroidota bacterium]